MPFTRVGPPVAAHELLHALLQFLLASPLHHHLWVGYRPCEAGFWHIFVNLRRQTAVFSEPTGRKKKLSREAKTDNHKIKAPPCFSLLFLGLEGSSSLSLDGSDVTDGAEDKQTRLCDVTRPPCREPARLHRESGRIPSLASFPSSSLSWTGSS